MILHVPIHLQATWDDFQALWNEYQQSRVPQVKQRANRLLDTFVAVMQREDETTRTTFAYSILRTWDTADPNIPHPYISPLLVKTLVCPVLVQAYSKQHMPALRWLAEYCDTPEVWHQLRTTRQVVLEQAVLVDPTDIQAWRLLVAEYLHTVAYGAHELPGGLVLPLEQCRVSLRQAELAVEQLAALQSEFAAQIQYYQQLYADWEAFQDSQSPNFQQWCDEHGRSYRWAAFAPFRR